MAAGCLYALDHHVERLAEDHEHARVLARGLASMAGVRLDPDTVETNIVIFEVDDARSLVQRIADRVELQVVDANHVRAVTHLDIVAGGYRPRARSVRGGAAADALRRSLR